MRSEESFVNEWQSWKETKRNWKKRQLLNKAVGCLDSLLFPLSCGAANPYSNTVILAIIKERDELAQTVADYVHRLDELQSEGLLYRAQRRIDEREIKMLRRECEEKVFIAKSEALESRMMIRQLQYATPPFSLSIFFQPYCLIPLLLVSLL
jgi:hypothetical protein